MVARALSGARFVAGAGAAAVLALAGCGGSSTEVAVSTSDGARFAPASTPAFVEIDTDVDGQQWRQSDRLLDRFPARTDLVGPVLDELEQNDLEWKRDIRPALGDALYLVWLDLAHDGDDVVGYTRPANGALFDRLLDRQDDPPLVHREIEGWTVFAESDALIDRFQDERSRGSLADEEVYRESLSGLPEDALATAFISGPDVQRALNESLAESGSDRLTAGLGELESVSAALTAKESGVLLVAGTTVEGAARQQPFAPELPESVPAGALVYVSLGDLRDTLDRALGSFEDSNPTFAKERAAVETALGLSIKDDLFPLFGKETGFALYRGTSSTPVYALYLRVDSEEEARRLLDRLGTLAALGGEATTRTFSVGDTEVRELAFREYDLSVYATVSQGRLIVTDSEEVLRDSLDGGPSLAEDQAFRSGEAAAQVPDQVTGLVYVDVPASVRAYYEQEGESVPKETREYVDPLGAAVLYAEQDGDRQRFNGFLQIR